MKELHFRIPSHIKECFAFWGLKVSGLVHTFGDFVGILSHAHQRVLFAFGLFGWVTSIGQYPLIGYQNTKNLGKGYLNLDEDTKQN